MRAQIAVALAPAFCVALLLTLASKWLYGYGLALCLRTLYIAPNGALLWLSMPMLATAAACGLVLWLKSALRYRRAKLAGDAPKMPTAWGFTVFWIALHCLIPPAATLAFWASVPEHERTSRLPVVISRLPDHLQL